MTVSRLQSIHPTLDKDITPFGTWLFHRVTILFAGFLSMAPFVAFFTR
jgi:hypothetical protein